LEIDHKKIAVLMGGVSDEREISLMSGRSVLAALNEEGLSAVGIDVVDDKGDALKMTLQEKEIDVVFIALHGRFGEDGGIQRFLEKVSMPYSGSGVVASAVCFNKYAAKQLFSSAGICTPPCYLATERSYSREKIGNLGFPVVVKPRSEGSAIGVSVVREEKLLEKALEHAFKHDGCALVEKYIPGMEITVSVIGNDRARVLPIIKIAPKQEFYNYLAKYEPGMSEHILPAPLLPDKKKQVEDIGISAYHTAGCRGFARIDMIVAEDGVVYVLEINTIPGLTGTSLFPEAARADGITLGRLCRELLEMTDR